MKLWSDMYSSWKMFVPHAATAVAIMRFGDSDTGSMQAVSQRLAKNGMHFVMARTISNQYKASEKRADGYPLLGVLHYHYTTDEVDYAHYEICRDTFLRTARAQKLLQVGGIHARIARDFFDRHSISYDFDGPLLSTGPRQELVNSGTGMVDMIDVGLTTEELDLVSGVYHVYQREIKHKRLNYLLTNYPKLDIHSRDGFPGGLRTEIGGTAIMTLDAGLGTVRRGTRSGWQTYKRADPCL